jgi:hypothetical protein
MKPLLLVIFLLSSLFVFSQSQLTTAWCGSTTSSLGVNVFCNGITGSIGYKFEVREVDGTYVGEYNGYLGNTTNKFRFSWMPSGTIQYSTTYHIRVSWFNGVVWSSWGPTCQLSTPDQPLTQLTTTWCDNSNVLTSGTNIFCTSVPGSVQYQFTISSPSGFITNLVKTSNTFKLSDLPSPHPFYGLQYNVEVRTRQTLSEPFGDPGSVCFVKLAIPTTTISTNDCGRTINYLQQDTLHVLPLSGVEGYRYKIEEGLNVIIDTVVNLSSYTGITLRKFPGIQYCKTYSISVKVKMNGTWGNWGMPCNISTTCNPTTELRTFFQDNSIISSCGTNIYFNTILFATQYQYSIVGGSINEIYVSPSSGFKLQQLSSYNSVTYNTTYQIKCRVLLNNVWQPWGPTGTITLMTTTQLSGLCNQSVLTFGTNIYSIGVGCAGDYRFRINGPGLSNYIHNPSTMTNCFRLSQISGIQFNQSYVVEVQFLAGGVWSNWGPSCVINTPMAILPHIYPIPFTTTFKIDSVNLTKPILIMDINGRLVETVFDVDMNVGENLPMGVYFIIIEGGVYKIIKGFY